MSLPARITDFQPLATILSGEVDSEFNNLVNILNGTDQTKNIRVRSNDNSFAVARFDQLGSTANIVEFYSGGVEVGRVEKDGDLVCLGLTGAVGVYTFSSIPVGPNANPTTDNQLARKLYVDTRSVSFTVAFIVPDPSSPSLNSREFGSFVVPAGGTYTFTRGRVMFRQGSHTSGGSVTFKIDLAFVGDKATLTLDNTNNTIATLYTDNFGDFTAGEGSIFNAYISARSGTITERDVAVVLEGFRTVF
jgi:hypothetical protein